MATWLTDIVKMSLQDLAFLKADFVRKFCSKKLKLKNMSNRFWLFLLVQCSLQRDSQHLRPYSNHITNNRNISYSMKFTVITL